MRCYGKPRVRGCAEDFKNRTGPRILKPARKRARRQAKDQIKKEMP